MRSGQIAAPQPDAPCAVRGAPVDGGIHHIVAGLAEPVVRVPGKTTVVVITDYEVQVSGGRGQTESNARRYRLFRGSHRIMPGSIPLA